MMLQTSIANTDIRAYRPGDRAAVLRLFRLNTPAFFAPAEEADLIRYLDEELEYYFVVESAGAIIGSGGFNFSGDETTGKISWDMLHPDFQGMGIGSSLLKHRLERLQAFDGLERVIVRTSQLAYRFYEKHGFRLTDVAENYWAEGFHLYLMEQKLRIEPEQNK